MSFFYMMDDLKYPFFPPFFLLSFLFFSFRGGGGGGWFSSRWLFGTQLVVTQSGLRSSEASERSELCMVASKATQHNIASELSVSRKIETRVKS